MASDISVTDTALLEMPQSEDQFVRNSAHIEEVEDAIYGRSKVSRPDIVCFQETGVVPWEIKGYHIECLKPVSGIGQHGLIIEPR